jgi:hypothetical protein
MRWLLLLLPIFLFACVKDKPASPKKAVEVTYEITKDSSVGTLNIKPGDFGEFTPAPTAAGEEFRLLWEKAKAEGTITVDSHTNSKRGERSYTSRLYRPTDADFAEAVLGFLLSKNYDVKTIPNVASGPTSQ